MKDASASGAEVPGSQHMTLMRAAALAFLRARLTSKPEGEDREDLKIFSCSLAPGAFWSLASTFVHPGCRPAILAGSAAEELLFTAEDLIPESKLGSRIWFSVVDAQPYRSKRAMRGDLSSADVAIAVHRMAAVVRPREVLVTTTPVNISTVAAMKGQIQDAPLVLTTSAFTYEQLAEIGVSTMERGLSYMWGHVDKVVFDPRVSALLQQLLHEDGDGHKLAEGGDSEGLRSLFSAWEAEALVTRSTSQLGGPQWQLTDRGRKSIIVAFTLYKHTLFLEPRSIAVGEMTQFELLRKLESTGWAFCLAPVNAKGLKKLRGNPYVHPDSPKVWHRKAGTSLEKRDANYVLEGFALH